MSEDPTLVLHSGSYHADDAITALLARKRFGDKLKLVRTRDPILLKRYLDQESKGYPVHVYDVGEGPGDHHGKSARNDKEGVPYCGATLFFDRHAKQLFPNDPAAAKYFRKSVLVPLAKLDNGRKLDPNESSPYSDLVARLNPIWDEKHKDYDARFKDTVNTLGPLIDNEMERARSISRAAPLLRRLRNNKSRVVQLPNLDVPGWQEVLGNPDNPAQLVISSGGYNRPGVIRVVPDRGSGKGKFDSKLLIPEKYRGLSGRELDRVAGINGLTFCHNGGFTAGASNENALKRWADKILQEHDLEMVNS